MTRSSIHGIIFDDRDRPLSGAAVTLTPLSTAADLPDIAATTNDEGRYAWTDLDDGRYQVTATLDGYHTVVTETVVEADAQSRVNFHLPPRTPRTTRHFGNACGVPEESHSAVTQTVNFDPNVIDEIS